MIAPVLPSWFDEDCTRRFLKDIEEIKRVRKGKVGVHLVANRMRAAAAARPSGCGRSSTTLGAGAGRLDRRARAYADLAEQGLSVFDRPQRSYCAAAGAVGAGARRRSA